MIYIQYYFTESGDSHSHNGIVKLYSNYIQYNPDIPDDNLYMKK